MQQLTKFLVQEQNEKVDEKEVSRHMRDYLQDTQRNVIEPYFTISEVSVKQSELLILLLSHYFISFVSILDSEIR